MIRTLPLVVLATLAAAPASAASPGFCQTYADNAPQQYHHARATPGCYKRTSNLWHAIRPRHFAWCLSVHPAAARA